MRRFLPFLLGFILFLGFPPLVWAEEPPEVPQLTLEQAIALAMDNSTTLKADLLAIDQAKEDRDAAGLAVTYTPTGRATPEVEAAFTRLQNADLAWRMAKKTYEADRDSVVMKVYQAYTGVLQACAAVDAAEKALRSTDWQHRAAVAGYRAGTLSKSQMIQADASAAGAQAQLAAAEKALDDAYHKFNQLVGLSPDERPLLTDRPEYAPLHVDSLEAEVARAVDASPYVWLAQRKIDLAKIALDIYSFGPAEAHTYKATELGIPIAEVNAAGARDQMALLVRSLYYSIRQLEENYAGLQQKVTVDEENLRVTRLKYDLGLATRTEVFAAEAALAGSKKSLLDAVCQHEVLKLAFKKPWAYAGAGSNGSAGS